MILNKLIAPLCEDDINKHWLYTDKVYISCVCVSFNQKDYIRDTIDSFLAQKTEYRFEIIIHDDASTDGTRDILLDYEQKYPSIIKLIIQDENQYSKGRRITSIAVSYASGEYIALCEGDDFWIDKQKLQKQIKIFIDDQNVSLVHTGALDLVQKTGDVTESKIPSSCNTTESLFKENRIRTLTTMFSKKIYEKFHDENKVELNKWLLGDWPLWIYCSLNGKIIFLDNQTSVYRILEESASHSKDRVKIIKFSLSTYQMLYYMSIKYYTKEKTKDISNNIIKLLTSNYDIFSQLKYDDKNSNIFNNGSYIYKVVFNLNKKFPIYKAYKNIIRFKS
ncbi:glycosyl transferase [Photobacterium phosphoreum]|uniref:glycosyltransferase n=1 Tax=Photobacterium phosphoreum TaxID=659 RepID=UPI000D1520FF|nr:glycosyltransferase [Photobacterium phosphoreum]PSW30357.1 glycosyl transferase [Photobacterium phosphoreum]